MMIGWHVLLGIVLVVPAYFLWTLIHEASHLLAVRCTTGMTYWDLKAWPHRYEGTLRWGGTSWKWARLPSTKEAACISLAPRLPDLVAALVFPAVALSPSYWVVVWTVFWGAGIIDLVVGSIGYSERSDLRTAAPLLGINPWLLRLGGFAVATISVAMWIGSSVR